MPLTSVLVKAKQLRNDVQSGKLDLDIAKERWKQFKEESFPEIIRVASAHFEMDSIPKTYKVKNGREKMTSFSMNGEIITNLLLTRRPYQRFLLLYLDDGTYNAAHLHGPTEEDWQIEIKSRNMDPVSSFRFGMLLEGIGDFLEQRLQDKPSNLLVQMKKLTIQCEAIAKTIGDELPIDSEIVAEETRKAESENESGEKQKLPVGMIVSETGKTPFAIRSHSLIASAIVDDFGKGATIEVYGAGDLQSSEKMLAHLSMIMEMMASSLYEQGHDIEEIREKFFSAALNSLTSVLVKDTRGKTTDPELINKLEEIQREIGRPD